MRPARRSSIEGEAEYAFWHILTRDVAYGQLPRPSRASRHVAAAAWIESQGPRADRRPRRRARLPLRNRAGPRPRGRGHRQAAELEDPALRFLTLAGERALGLDTDRRADQSRARARARPRGPPRPARARSRLRRGRASRRPPTRRKDALEEAITALHARGDLQAQRMRWAAGHRPHQARRSALGRAPRRRRWRCWNPSRQAPRWWTRSPRLLPPRRSRA